MPKLIKICAECADYDMKKHRCRRGATREEDPRNPFYDDCPLPDAVAATDINVGATAEHCVCCGDIIPEGRQVCIRCEGGTK